MATDLAKLSLWLATLARDHEFTFLDHALKTVPMNRVGQPAEVAAVVSFLMSDAASYVTRQVIGVNGGMI